MRGRGLSQNQPSLAHQIGVAGGEGGGLDCIWISVDQGNQTMMNINFGNKYNGLFYIKFTGKKKFLIFFNVANLLEPRKIR